MKLWLIFHIGLMVVAILGAILGWGLAAVSAVNVVRLSQSGQRISNLFILGMWRFALLEQRIGPGVLPFLKRYRLGFQLFFGGLFLQMVLGALLALAPQS
jgi:hypothetical protein